MTDPFDPQSAVDRYFDEELDSAAFAQLHAWLEENPEAATQFTERAFLHSRLSMIHAQQKGLGEASLEQQVAESVEEVHSLASTEQKTARSPLLGFLYQLPGVIHPVHHPVWFLATATVLTMLFWAVAVAIMWPRASNPPAGTVAAQPMQSLPFIARLARAEDVVWAEGSTPLRPGAVLHRDQQLNLLSGRLQIQFGDGARAAVEGPASLQIDGRNRMTLDHGRLLAQVSTAARGFAVRTPVVGVVDVGTEFGVNSLSAETEVEVFAGKVEVQPVSDPRDRKRAMTAGEAAVFGISPQQGFYVKEKKMNRAIYLSLAVVLSLPAVELVQGAVISMNFQGGGGSGALVGSQTAGYIPAGNWNDISGSTFPAFPYALNDDSGAPSGTFVSVAGANNNGSGTPPTAPMGAGDIAMLSGNIFTASSTPVTVTVSGAIPYAQYDVYVYFNGAVSNHVQTFSLYDGSSNFIQAKDALQADSAADTAFTLATPSTDGNYIVFSGLSNSTLPNFILTASPVTQYGYLNGIQIHDTTPPLPIPEPTTSALLGLGGLVLLAKARRRTRKA